MHRFFLPPDQCKGDALSLPDPEAHHALHVLRLRRSEQVTILDGEGGELLCEVRECDRSQVHLTVLRRSSAPARSCQITLLQAVPKGKLIEAIIQKATELGAHRIIPILSQRVASRLDDPGAAQKASKWQLTAVEAIKQCGSAWLPKVEPPVTPAEFLRRKESFEIPLVASLQPGSRHAHECFQAFRSAHGRPPRSACVWVGPEGDFTPEEVAAIQSSGALPISLGPLVLRCETAAVYCLSILNHEIGISP
jgi:16S rRNA (uracil1498-N3)-methyltransferase